MTCPMVLRFWTGMLAAILGLPLRASNPPLITYDPRPLGSVERPLVLRTYLPDPGVDTAVFRHHGRGAGTAEYSPEQGADIPGTVVPLMGIPAAIAVNHGTALSYVFDATEGRLLYAWHGGFLDLFPYWGDQALGTRLYDYVPRLIGSLFYKTAGEHPLEINGASVSQLGAPRFVGYDLVKGWPEFLVRHGDYTVRTKVRPAGKPGTLQVEFTAEPAGRLSYRTDYAGLEARQQRAESGALVVTLSGGTLGQYQGYSREMTLKEASVAAGEQVFRNYGCAVCHSTDGSLGHGPTWSGLFGRERRLVDGSTVVADEGYLLEAIKNPNAKILQGFALNFMPAYPSLHELEYQSLLLFIKSLRSGK